MNVLSKTGLLVLLSLFGIELLGQVVNIEQRRIQPDSLGWSGEMYLNVTAQRNSNNVFTVSTGSNIYVKRPCHSWLLLSEYNLIRAGSTNFSNELFAHLRYDRRLSNYIKLEGFIQVQRNVLTKLDLRALLGSGVRIKLTDYENARFYWGSTYMMELDETNEPNVSNYHHRISSYFSFSLFPQDDVSFVSTTYMQPRLDQWSDYRLHTESNLGLSISSKLRLNIRFSLAYDSEPPQDVPGLTYYLLNGLSYRFR